MLAGVLPPVGVFVFPYSNWTWQFVGSLQWCVLDSVQHLWWRVFAKILELLTIFAKTLYHICLAGPKNASVFYWEISRSSCPEVFCKKDILKNFTNVTGKHLRRNLFLNKNAGLWHSNTGVFLRILQNFWEQLFYRTPPVAPLINKKRK